MGPILEMRRAQEVEEALEEYRKRIDEFLKKEEEDRLKAAAEAEKARLDAEESDERWGATEENEGGTILVNQTSL